MAIASFESRSFEGDKKEAEAMWRDWLVLLVGMPLACVLVVAGAIFFGIWRGWL